jgi:hypothetical protein
MLTLKYYQLFKRYREEFDLLGIKIPSDIYIDKEEGHRILKDLEGMFKDYHEIRLEDETPEAVLINFAGLGDRALEKSIKTLKNYWRNNKKWLVKQKKGSRRSKVLLHN